MRAIRQVLSWVLSLFLIAILLHWTVHPWPQPDPGQVIFYDLPGEHILFSTLALKSGYEWFEPTGRVVFGVFELLAALMILIPHWRKTGAKLAVVIFGILIALHLSPWLGIELQLPGNSGSDDGSVFYLTVAAITAAILLINLHPTRLSR